MISTLNKSIANNKNYSNYENTLRNNGSFKRLHINALAGSNMTYHDLPNLVHINRRTHLIFQGAKFEFALFNNHYFDRISLWILNRFDNENNNSFGINISNSNNSVANSQNNNNNNFSDSNISQITKSKRFYNIVITFIKKQWILMFNKRVTDSSSSNSSLIKNKSSRKQNNNRKRVRYSKQSINSMYNFNSTTICSHDKNNQHVQRLNDNVIGSNHTRNLTIDCIIRVFYNARHGNTNNMNSNVNSNVNNVDSMNGQSRTLKSQPKLLIGLITGTEIVNTVKDKSYHLLTQPANSHFSQISAYNTNSKNSFYLKEIDNNVNIKNDIIMEDAVIYGAIHGNSNLMLKKEEEKNTSSMNGNIMLMKVILCNKRSKNNRVTKETLKSTHKRHGTGQRNIPRTLLVVVVPSLNCFLAFNY